MATTRMDVDMYLDAQAEKLAGHRTQRVATIKEFEAIRAVLDAAGVEHSGLTILERVRLLVQERDGIRMTAIKASVERKKRDER